MPPTSIPDRDPVGDPVTGFVLLDDAYHLLTLDAPPAGEVIASGNLIVRYGAPYLGKPHLSIVPGLIALDYGDMLTGSDAWDFLVERSNRYPRADVIGYRNDGKDEMMLVKQLDLALDPHVLIYADAEATKPLARINALIAPAEHADIPTRLLDYLPHYNDLAAWTRHIQQEEEAATDE